MSKLTIGQMSNLNHVSTQTLRLYDKLGLLKPQFVDDKNGYRYYNIKQSAKFDMIQYMKSLGMSLDDIKKLFDNHDINSIKNILIKKKEQIKKQIKFLKYQERAIEHAIDNYEHYEASPPDGKILVEYINKRYIYCFDSKINFYDFDLEVYEVILRKLKENLIANNLPPIYFCNVGSIMHQENLTKGNYNSTKVFVFVDKDYVSPNIITTIKSNTYLCMYCNNFNSEKEYINRLLEFANKNNYKIIGDYICEVISDLPIFDNYERGMFLRLQIPVEII